MPAGSCWAMTSEETFGQLLGLGKAWRLVEARLEGRGCFGGDPGPLDSRSDHRLHGGAQQPVLSREA
jgi:hypothetical protein